MGKIVKYCNACEEGFAEKFGFCPNCGAQLTAFEMNPLSPPEPVQATPVPAPSTEPAPTVNVFETKEEIVVKPLNEVKTTKIEPLESAVEAPASQFETKDAFEFDAEVFGDKTEEVFEDKTEEYVVPETAAFQHDTPETYQATYQNVPLNQSSNIKSDNGFHVTIVREKNVKQRNLLLLGSFIFFFFAFGAGFVYSMFNKYLEVGEIESPELISYVNDLEPTPFEEEQLKKDKEKGGGGGGGGKEEDTPASKGREAAQVDNPLFAPSSRMDKVTNPDIAIQAATKNKNERPAENSDDPYGLKDGTDGRSDGTGTGGGLGNGKGRGQGNGDGDGFGNGRGNGRGNGDGNGEGDGKGNGGNNDPLGDLEVKKKPVGPTVGVKIISKPRPSYTDSARINNVQGTVVLKVTFLASGQVGGVSVIKGLPNGLTEQAIAAAKSIRFEPAKRGGQPYSVTKQVDYSFTIF